MIRSTYTAQNLSNTDAKLELSRKLRPQSQQRLMLSSMQDKPCDARILFALDVTLSTETKCMFSLSTKPNAGNHSKNDICHFATISAMIKIMYNISNLDKIVRRIYFIIRWKLPKHNNPVSWIWQDVLNCRIYKVLTCCMNTDRIL